MSRTTTTPSLGRKTEAATTHVLYVDIHGICARYTIRRRTVWRWVRQDILPAPTYFAGRGSGGRWRLDELDRRDAEREKPEAA